MRSYFNQLFQTNYNLCDLIFMSILEFIFACFQFLRKIGEGLRIKELMR